MNGKLKAGGIGPETEAALAPDAFAFESRNSPALGSLGLSHLRSETGTSTRKSMNILLFHLYPR